MYGRLIKTPVFPNLFYFKKQKFSREIYYNTIMKILYVITSTGTGGAEKELLLLSSAMQEQGHQIHVVCLKPLGSIAGQMQQQGIEVKSIYSHLPGQMVRRIKTEIENFKPDIVHAMLFRAIEYTRMACAGKDIKLVITPHFDLSKKPFFLRIFDFLLKGIDTLAVAESFSTATYLVKHQHYLENKVYLLPNGIDKTKFYPDISLREKMRKQYGFHVKTPVFICVARLAAVKDPMTLLQAFRNVWLRDSQARLIYVGEGEERAKLERFIRQAGLEKAVILAGEQKDVNAYLNMADVFVLSSLEESLPLALLEAISVGLPCIVSHVGDMPQWVTHGENGYIFPPQDITLLSCELNLLAQDIQMRKEMSEKSLEKATQITDSFTQYQQLYQQILAGEFSREN